MIRIRSRIAQTFATQLKYHTRTITTIINNRQQIQQRRSSTIQQQQLLSIPKFASFSSSVASTSPTSVVDPVLNRSSIIKPAGTGFEGDWAGVISFGSVKLRLQLHLTKLSDGAWTATLDSVDQAAFAIPCTRVAVEKDKIVVELDNIGAKYEAALNADGKLDGSWTQGGGTVPLQFDRTTEPATASKRLQEPMPPFPYEEVEVTFENNVDQVRIAGTLTLPAKRQQPAPAVVLITGSGAQNRNEEIFGHKPFLLLADYLTRRGIAVLRCDDRGVGGSTGRVDTSTTAQLAGDVACAVRYLRAQHSDVIDGTRIGLLGHSEGGIIAPMVASQKHPDAPIAFVVMLAGTTVPGDEIVMKQGELISRASSTDDDAMHDWNAHCQKEIFALMKRELKNPELESLLVDKMRKLLEQTPAEQRGAVNMEDFTMHAQQLCSNWFKFFISHDPLPELQKVTCPILALFGEKDLQVSPAQNEPRARQALFSNADATIEIMPGVNHLFQTCTTGAPSEYSVIEETLSPIVLERVSGWISKRFVK